VSRGGDILGVGGVDCCAVVLWLLVSLACQPPHYRALPRVLVTISFLLETQNTDIADLSMDMKDTDVLRDIHQVIEVPHIAQELLSSERTPTLSMALPAYELLTGKWTQLQSTIWELSHYIGVGLDKLRRYINEG
jgi:hypothetical protein